MENLTGGTPPVRYLPCVVPCKLYFLQVQHTFIRQHFGKQRSIHIAPPVDIKWYQFISVYRSVSGNARGNTVIGMEESKIEIVRPKSDEINIRFQRSFLEVNVFANW